MEKYIFHEKREASEEQKKEKWVTEVSVLFWPSFQVPHLPKHDMNPTLNTLDLYILFAWKI